MFGLCTAFRARLRWTKVFAVISWSGTPYFYICRPHYWRVSAWCMLLVVLILNSSLDVLNPFVVEKDRICHLGHRLMLYERKRSISPSELHWMHHSICLATRNDLVLFHVVQPLLWWIVLSQPKHVQLKARLRLLHLQCHRDRKYGNNKWNFSCWPMA